MNKPESVWHKNFWNAGPTNQKPQLCLISPFPPLLARSSEFYFCITCGNTLIMAFCSSLSFDKVWDLNSRGEKKNKTHKSPQVFWAKEHREIPMLKKSVITTCVFLVYQLYLNKAIFFFFFLSPWQRIFNLKSGRELMLAPLQVSDLACLGRGWRTTFLGRFHLILKPYSESTGLEDDYITFTQWW